MRKHTVFTVAVYLLALSVACTSRPDNPRQQEAVEEEKENLEAKKQLQGIWLDNETEEVSFRVMGDTIFYPDSVSQPTSFRVVKDSLVLDAVGAKYPIVKQSAHVFSFRNQNGDEVTFCKSDDPIHAFAFVQDKPKVRTYTEVIKNDSVVFYDGTRYHWYLVINPTKYKVHATSYNDDGVEVDNVYYDNIMHVSVFKGANKLFSTDFKKQLFASKIPQQFLDQSVLSNMEFKEVDERGFHFVATICIPDGAACYKAENIVSFDGKLTTTLIEY